jgi:hypothetical protein
MVDYVLQMFRKASYSRRSLNSLTFFLYVSHIDTVSRGSVLFD